MTFQRACRQCFNETGQSILLEQASTGDWYCPKNPKHVTPENDVIVA